MIALIGGLGAALSWAMATLAATRASRSVGPFVATAWVMMLGLILVAPLVAWSGIPPELNRGSVGWLALSGGANVLGIGVIYTALRSGLVGIISAIVSAEGAIAALIAISVGEPVSAGLVVAFAVITAGVMVTAGASPSTEGPVAARHGASLALAAAAAVIFGVSLYATGRASTLPAIWVALPARLIGTVVVALPLATAGRLRVPFTTLRFIAVAAVGEVLGFLSFSWGSREGIAVASVCAAPVAVFAATGAFLLFHERLGRLQIAGILVTLVGVAAIGALAR